MTSIDVRSELRWIEDACTSIELPFRIVFQNNNINYRHDFVVSRTANCDVSWNDIGIDGSWTPEICDWDPVEGLVNCRGDDVAGGDRLGLGEIKLNPSM